MFLFIYLFESTVQVKLPPIEKVGIEREVVVIFSTVAGVGQNVATAFGETQKHMPGTKNITQHCKTGLCFNNTHYQSSI